MNSTTADKRVPPSRILAISVALQLLGGVLLFLLTPLHTSRLTAVAHDVRELDREAARRRQRLEEQRRGTRERTVLPEDHAERLSKERQTQAAQLMQERIEAMRTLRDEVREAAVREKEQLRNRDIEEVAKRLHDRLQPLASQLLENARVQVEHPSLPAAPHVLEAAEALLAEVDRAPEQMLQPERMEKLNEAYRKLHNHQDAAIHQLQAAQAAYPDDEVRIREENHMQYGVNLMRDRFAEILREAVSLDPAGINDLPSEALATAPAPASSHMAQGSEAVGDLHQQAFDLFLETQHHATVARAADMAARRHQSLGASFEQVALPTPDLVFQGTGSDPPGTVGDLQALQTGLDEAVRDVNRLWQSAHNMAMAVRGTGGSGPAPSPDSGRGPTLPGDAAGGAPSGAVGGGRALAAARAAAYRTSGRYANMTRFQVHRGPGERGAGGPGAGGRDVTHRSIRTGTAEVESEGADDRMDPPFLDEEEVLREALPGRRFSPDSPRTGWLYIDTWYVIGPWENHGRLDFPQTFPPETLVDLDAEYLGKDGRRVSWRFHQSDNIRIKPPHETEHATYYGYTEVYFEEAADMLIAVASDDAARIWLNGDLIWEDDGLSPWRLDEGFRRVHFQQGFNTILLRVDNGPITCTFSVLLCPLLALAPDTSRGMPLLPN